MKITARQYAASLYESLSGQTEAEAVKTLQRFVALLGEQRALVQAAEIIERFREIWDQAHNELSAELISARPLEKSAKEAIIAYLSRKTGVQAVNLRDSNDPQLLGGFILRYNGRVIDGSLRGSLDSLKNKLSN